MPDEPPHPPNGTEGTNDGRAANENDMEATEGENDVVLPLTTHLEELRKRLIYCGITILTLFFVLFYFADPLYTFVAKPLLKWLPSEGMIATEVATPFLVPLKLSLAVAFLLGIPVIFYHLWAFVAPGLYTREKRFIAPLLLTSILLFYAGITFAYVTVLPLAFNFFVATTPAGVTMMTDINQYLSFVLRVFFAFGIAFEIPIATFLLVRTGLLDYTTLTQNRPYVITVCFIAGMLLTPPDVISQVLLAVPMWLLFEIGILFARWSMKTSSKTDPSES